MTIAHIGSPSFCYHVAISLSSIVQHLHKMDRNPFVCTQNVSSKTEQLN